MNEAELPAPLVPAWVDLRSYDWFPFYHKRLRQSEFWKSASDLACRISVDLWSEAYEQVPAGSIPDSDHILSEWAGFGRRDLTGWLSAKDEVLSAWALCSDGRWYHPTLSEVARQAGVERRKHLWAKECDRIRKENIRRQKAGSDPLPTPPKPSDDPWKGGAFLGSSDGEPASDNGRPKEDGAKSERGPLESLENPPENALTGTRTETRKEIVGGAHASAREDTHPAVCVDPPKPRRRGRQPSQETTWPDDLAIGQADLDYAAKHGFPGTAGERLFEKFEAKAKAKGWTYRDWHAAFRNFVLNEHPPPPRLNGSQAWRPPDV